MNAEAVIVADGPHAAGGPNAGPVPGRGVWAARLCGAAIVAVGVAVWGALVSVRPLWHDEIFTVSFARAEGPVDVVRQLRAARETNPPLSFLAVHASMRVFGEMPWAARLPAGLGTAAAAGSLWLYIARRRGPAEAWLAVAVLGLFDQVWYFALEARAYGLFLGFTGMSFLGWQAATAGPRHRRLGLIGLGAALALGTLTHYYFLTVAAALAAGEVVRVAGRRRIDWPVAVTLAVPAVVFALLAPLWLGAAREYGPGFHVRAPIGPATVHGTYAENLGSRLLAVYAVVGVAAAAGAAALGRDAGPAAGGLGYPRWELAGLVALAACPLPGAALGWAGGGAYLPRYCLPLTLGVAGVAAFALARTGGGRGCLALALAFGCAGGAMQLRTQTEWRGAHAVETAAQSGAVTALLATDDVLVGGRFDALRLWHAVPGDRSRLFLTADPIVAARYEGTDSWDRNVRSVALIQGAALLDTEGMLRRAAAGPVYFVGVSDDWRIAELVKAGYRCDRIGTAPGVGVYSVTRRP